MSNLQITFNVAFGMLQIVIGYICTDFVSMLNLHFMSQYTDKYQTAAYGLAWMIINLFVTPLGLGINHALNHQVSHALGQQKYKLALTYFNFTLYSIILYSIPFFIIIYNLNLLRWFTTETIIIDYASKMIIPLCVTSFLILIIECIKQYLVAQQIFQPFPYIYSLTVIFHLLICLLFFKILKMGGIAVCIAMILSELFTLTLLIMYIYYKSNVRELFKNLDYKFLIFKHKSVYKNFINEAIPLVLHIYADFIVFYVLSLIAFQLGVDQANAQMAFANTSSIYFKFPISLSITLMSYVGNSLSQKNIKQAKQYIYSGISVYLIILLFLLIILKFFTQEWASIYSQDSNIKEIMLKTLPYFILGSVCFDGFQGTLSGALKGVNKQTVVSNQTMISYYIIGVPLILILTFVFDLQLIGIWLGFGISNCYLTIYFVYILYKLNWEDQVKQIGNKLQQHENCFDDIELPIIE